MNSKILRKIKKIHKWGAWISSLPLFIIICTGILLANRNLLKIIQPEVKTGSINLTALPLLSIERVIEIAKTVPEAQIERWEDIKSIEVKLKKGVYSVRSLNDYEVQVDFRTENILSRAPRLTTFLVRLHEGTFFNSQIILYFFKICGLIFFVLYLSGILMLIYPYFISLTAKKDS